MDSKIDMQQVEKMVLTHLKGGAIENTEQFSEENKVSREDLDPVLKSLSAEEYVKLEVIEKKLIELTDEGKGYASNGSPEFQFVSKMGQGETVSMPTMEERVGKQIAKVGMGKAMKQKWIEKAGADFKRIAENPVDEDQTNLNKFL